MPPRMFSLLAIAAVALSSITTAAIGNPKQAALHQATQTAPRKPPSPMGSVTRPLREVTLTSAAGTIAEVFVHEGQQVTKGQRLLVFDRRMSEARVKMAEAEYQSSLSTVKVTELESQLSETRYQSLAKAYRQDAATEVEVKEAHVRLQQSRARYAAAIDAVKQSQEQVKYAHVENQLRELVAPFDGTAVRVFATPGQTPTVSQPLVQIVDVSKLRAELYLPIARYDNQTTNFILIADAPVNRELESRLVVMDTVIDPATQTIRCVLEVDNRDAKLPSGFRVQLKSARD